MQLTENVMHNVQVLKEFSPDVSRVLTPDALAFVATLHRPRLTDTFCEFLTFPAYEYLD